MSTTTVRQKRIASRHFENPIARLLVSGLCIVYLFHGAHRFKYTMYDGLQVKHLNEMLNTFCYGGAVVGTLIAGYVLYRL